MTPQEQIARCDAQCAAASEEHRLYAIEEMARWALDMSRGDRHDARTILQLAASNVDLTDWQPYRDEVAI